VTAVRLPTPSLALFLAGGALIGAGAGLVFKGTTGIVLEAAAPEERVAMTSTLIMTALFGLSIPVIGAGIALSRGASPANTVLGFGTAVALGVALSGWALLRRPASDPRGEPSGAAAEVEPREAREDHQTARAGVSNTASGR
jgi:MFS family permease